MHARSRCDGALQNCSSSCQRLALDCGKRLTTESDSVAQPIERVSAASAVSPNNPSFENNILFPNLFETDQISLNCLGDVYSLHTKRNVVGYNSHGCRLISGLSQSLIDCPRGLMDKASVSEAEDCGFESRRGYVNYLCVDELHWCGVQTSNL